MLAISPLASADPTILPTPVPEPSSSAATADPAPSDTVSASPTPSASGPSSTSASPTENPSTSEPSVEPASPSPGESTSPGPTPSSTPADTKPAKAKAIEPNYGTQKVRVGVQIDPDSVVPPGTSTAGSVLTLTQTGPDLTDGPLVTTCTTEQPARVGAAADPPTYCPFTFFVGPGNTLTVTQTSAAAGLRIDTTTFTREPCEATDGPFCTGDDVVFTDQGEFAPTARADAGKVREGGQLEVDVLANDNRYGAPVIAVEITDQPGHGQVSVPDNPTGPLRYVPTPGFVGTDTFSYTYSTEFGTASATVTITVTAAVAPSPTPTPPGSPSNSLNPPNSPNPPNSLNPSGGGQSLADTGSPMGAGPWGVAGLLLTGAGAALLGRRWKPRGRHAR